MGQERQCCLPARPDPGFGLSRRSLRLAVPGQGCSRPSRSEALPGWSVRQFNADGPGSGPGCPPGSLRPAVPDRGRSRPDRSEALPDWSVRQFNADRPGSGPGRPPGSLRSAVPDRGCSRPDRSETLPGWNALQLNAGRPSSSPGCPRGSLRPAVPDRGCSQPDCVPENPGRQCSPCVPNRGVLSSVRYFCPMERGALRSGFSFSGPCRDLPQNMRRELGGCGTFRQFPSLRPLMPSPGQRAAQNGSRGRAECRQEILPAVLLEIGLLPHLTVQFTRQTCRCVPPGHTGRHLPRPPVLGHGRKNGLRG